MSLLKLLAVLSIGSTAAFVFPCSFGHNEHKKYVCVNYYSEIMDDVSVHAVSGNHVNGGWDNSRVEGIMILTRKTRRIPRNLLSHFSNLREINYSCLNTKGLCLDDSALFKGIFNGGGKVNSISLRGHNLEQLKAEIFEGVDRLEYLFLPLNFITEVHKDSFKGIKSLRVLALNGNQIRNLEVGTFDGMIYLESLQLQGNDLRTLSKDLFRYVKGLKQINLQQNKLNNIDFKFRENFMLLENVNLIDNFCIEGYFSKTNGSKDLKKLDSSLAICSAVQPIDESQPTSVDILKTRNRNLQKELAAFMDQDGSACEFSILEKEIQRLQREIKELLPFKTNFMVSARGARNEHEDSRIERRNGPQVGIRSTPVDYQLAKLSEQNQKLNRFNSKLNGFADELVDFMVDNVYSKIKS